MKKSFIQFLESISEDAYHNASLVEKNVFTNPDIAMGKARTFLECIVEQVFNIEKIMSEHNDLSRLFDRINYLSQKGFLTNEIQYDIHELRKLGNIGSHRSDENLEAAIKAHKLVYKVAVWFYETYSSETGSVPEYKYPKPQDQMESVKNYIKELVTTLSSNNIKVVEDLKNNDEEKVSKEETIQENEKLLIDYGSHLKGELGRLKESSKEAIENANKFSNFKEYLHVERKLQRDLIGILGRKSNSIESNLLLIIGSVGDGKSHLLAYLTTKHPELLHNYSIINDATESFSPSQNALEALNQSLAGYSDLNIDNSKKKTILAINMGVLHNFISNDTDNQYTYLKKFIKDSGLFTQKITQCYNEKHFDLICISDYRSYELSKDGVESEFYEELIDRVFNTRDKNPFYKAYKLDIKKGKYTATHVNYETLLNEQVKKTIIQLVIKVVIKYKVVISARSFLNFLVDIVFVEDNESYQMVGDFSKLEYSVANLLFNQKDRSIILEQLHKLNPYRTRRAQVIDELIIKLNTSENMESLIYDHIPLEIASKVFKGFTQDPEIANEPFTKLAEVIILTSYLTDKGFQRQLSDKQYESYIQLLYGFNKKDTGEISSFYRKMKDVLFKWRGSPKNEFMYINNDFNEFKLAQKIQLKPDTAHIEKMVGDKLDAFSDRITIAYKLGGSGNSEAIEIDYTLYVLLINVINGYVPNKRDEEDAIKLIELIEKLVKYGSGEKAILIDYVKDSKKYLLYKDDFGSYQFEKEED